MKKKKKEKAKPRTGKLADKASLKNRLFYYSLKEMEEKTKKYNKLHNEQVEFTLAQSKIKKDNNSILNKAMDLLCFYDKNFTGNKDFMLIPTLPDMASNLVNFPVITATRKTDIGSDEIIGITTIKYENNDDLKDNPYYPTEDKHVLSITGVLTQNAEITSSDNHIYGIGKELYKSSINIAMKINNEKPVKLICKIDCRNYKSLNAVTKAVAELQKEGYNISSCITGYYEICNKQKKLIEAPTFIVEINLDNNIYKNSSAHFSYLNCRPGHLNNDLMEEIKSKVVENKQYVNVVGPNTVIFHYIKPINTQNLTLEIGDSADGNNRMSYLNMIIKYFTERKKAIIKI